MWASSSPGTSRGGFSPRAFNTEVPPHADPTLVALPTKPPTAVKPGTPAVMLGSCEQVPSPEEFSDRVEVAGLDPPHRASPTSGRLEPSSESSEFPNPRGSIPAQVPTRMSILMTFFFAVVGLVEGPTVGPTG